ncbi:ER membrane protein complex subunit 1 [Durusdinium trenchii]|uniref:ER membrane protein complex subunit 1 n=1 Tax=Durusdinium trenchii TaxID=1381693 RepID=A0ABP0IW36_9DINO
MALLRWVVAALALGLGAALHEDQVGLSDWMLENLGRVGHVDFAIDGQVVAASDDGVVAAIGKDGTLKWREVLPDAPELRAGFPFAQLRRQKLFTLRGDGCAAYLWQAETSGLLWDASLCDGSGATAGGAVAGDFLAGDVTGDTNLDAAVLAGNTVRVLSGADGTIAKSFAAPADTSLLGLAHTLDVKSKKITLFAFGSNSKGELQLFNLPLAGASDAPKVVPLSTATEGEKPATVTGAGDVVVVQNLLVWKDAYSATLRAFDLSGRKAVETKIKTTGASKLLKLSKDAFSTNGGVYRVEKGKKEVAAVIKGSFAAVAAANGVAVAVEQSGDSASCGPIKSMKLVVDGGEPVSVAFPEVAGAGGQRGRVQALFVEDAGGQKARPTVRVVVRFQDDSLVAITVTLASASASLDWVREEALGAIVASGSVEMPPAESEGNFGDVVAHAFTHESALQVWLFRLRDQLRVLSRFFGSLTGTATGFLGSVVSSQGKMLVNMYKGDMPRSEGYTASELSAFGFRRALVVLTRSGKVLALDSMSGSVLWGVFDPAFATVGDAEADGAVDLVVTRAREAGASHPAEFALVSLRTGQVTWRNALTGAVVMQESKGSEMIHVMSIAPERLHHHVDGTPLDEEEDVSPAAVIVAVDKDLKMHVFPSAKRAKVMKRADVLSKVHFAHYFVGTRSLTGFVLNPTAGRAVELWTYVVPLEHELLAIEAHVGASMHTPGSKRGDGSVLVKYVNPHLLALVTKNPQNDLVVTLIDGVSGRVAKRFSHKKASGPVKAIVFDNMVVYTFLNLEMSSMATSVIGLYEGEIAKHGLNLWTPRGEDEVGSGGSFSSFGAAVSPNTMQRTFLTLNAARALGVTTTKHGISDMRVLIGLENGAVNMQVPQLLDPRRPTGRVSDADKADGLMEYFPTLPMVPTQTISYNLTVSRIAEIHTMPTRLESTSLVLVTGLDVFYARVLPSRGFDLLDEDFNFVLLVVLTSALFGLTVFLRGLASDKKLNEAWK